MEEVSKNKVKLITWNVNGVRACFEKDLPQFIKNQNMDILCLQETKAHIDQVEPEIKKLGFKYSLWSSGIRKGYSGVATFSNLEYQDSYTGIDSAEYDQEGRIAWTRHEKFDLYNIYFPNGSSGPERHQYKQNFLKELFIHLRFELSRGRQIIVVGDYNIAHQNQDVYSPAGLAKESGFLPEEKKWMDDFFSLGFIDCYRQFNPTKPHVYSWWSYKDMARQKNNGWRIDYICISKGLEKNLVFCDVLMDQQGSDHAPVVAEFIF